MTTWNELKTHVRQQFQLYRKLRDIMHEADVRAYRDKDKLIPLIKSLDVPQANKLLKELEIDRIREKY